MKQKIKCADHLRGYRAADLRFCFRIYMQNGRFSQDAAEILLNMGLRMGRLRIFFHMNLNATKRPFGHFDDSVGKQCKSRKICNVNF